MGSINLKYFEESSKGLVERQISFNAIIEADRDISRDNQFAQKISAELSPVMSMQTSISERVYEIGKHYSEPGQSNKIKM